MKEQQNKWQADWVVLRVTAPGGDIKPFYMPGWEYQAVIQHLYQTPYILHTWVEREGKRRVRKFANTPPDGYDHARTLIVRCRTVHMYTKRKA